MSLMIIYYEGTENFAARSYIYATTTNSNYLLGSVTNVNPLHWFPWVYYEGQKVFITIKLMNIRGGFKRKTIIKFILLDTSIKNVWIVLLFNLVYYNIGPFFREKKIVSSYQNIIILLLNEVLYMSEQRIFENFDIKEKFISVIPYGNGHINDTFLVQTKGKIKVKQYILQRINHRVFKNVEGLMNNIEIVTAYVNINSPSNVYQKIIKTKDNKNYYFCSDTYTYWRVYTFVEDGVSLMILLNQIYFMKPA